MEPVAAESCSVLVGAAAGATMVILSSLPPSPTSTSRSMETESSSSFSGGRDGVPPSGSSAADIGADGIAAGGIGAAGQGDREPLGRPAGGSRDTALFNDLPPTGDDDDDDDRPSAPAATEEPRALVVVAKNGPDGSIVSARLLEFPADSDTVGLVGCWAKIRRNSSVSNPSLQLAPPTLPLCTTDTNDPTAAPAPASVRVDTAAPSISTGLNSTTFATQKGTRLRNASACSCSMYI